MITKHTHSRSTDVPRSESTIPMSLSEIRRRCSDLLNRQGELKFDFDEAGQPIVTNDGGYNPYDRSG